MGRSLYKSIAWALGLVLGAIWPLEPPMGSQHCIWLVCRGVVMYDARAEAAGFPLPRGQWCPGCDIHGTPEPGQDRMFMPEVAPLLGTFLVCHRPLDDMCMVGGVTSHLPLGICHWLCHRAVWSIPGPQAMRCSQPCSCPGYRWLPCDFPESRLCCLAPESHCLICIRTELPSLVPS